MRILANENFPGLAITALRSRGENYLAAPVQINLHSPPTTFFR
jgi:hypothetical protein